MLKIHFNQLITQSIKKNHISSFFFLHQTTHSTKETKGFSI